MHRRSVASALLMEAVEGRGRKVSRIWKDEMTLLERAATQLGAEIGTSAKEDTPPPVPRPHLNSGRRRERSAEGDPEVVKMVLGNAKDGAGQYAHPDPSRIFLGDLSLQERALVQLKRSDKGKLATPSASSSGVPHGTESDAASVTDATTVDIYAAASSASGEEEEREPEPEVVQQVRAMIRDLPYIDWRNGEEEGEEDGSDLTDPVQRMLDVLKLHLGNEKETLREVNDEDTDTLANDPKYATEMRARAWSSGSSRRFTSRLNAHEAKVAASLVSCFDFTEPGVVTVDDWDRGTSLLGLEDEDAQLWGKLSGTFGDGDGGIDLARIPLRSAFSDPTLLASVQRTGSVGGDTSGGGAQISNNQIFEISIRHGGAGKPGDEKAQV